MIAIGIEVIAFIKRILGRIVRTQQGGASRNIQGHIAVQEQRASFEFAAGNQHLAALRIVRDGTAINGPLQRLGIQRGAVTLRAECAGFDDVRRFAGLRFNHRAVRRFLAIGVDRAHRKGILRIRLQVGGREAAQIDFLLPAVAGDPLIEVINIGLCRGKMVLIFTRQAQPLALTIDGVVHHLLGLRLRFFPDQHQAVFIGRQYRNHDILWRGGGRIVLVIDGSAAVITAACEPG